MSTQLAALVSIPQKESKGGLVVATYPSALGEEIHIYATWDAVCTSIGLVYPRADVHAIVNEYVVGDRTIFAALFHRLRPGTYKVFRPGESPPDGQHKNVTVTEGVVVQATFVDHLAARHDDSTHEYITIPVGGK